MKFNPGDKVQRWDDGTIYTFIQALPHTDVAGVDVVVQDDRDFILMNSGDLLAVPTSFEVGKRYKLVFAGGNYIYEVVAVRDKAVIGWALAADGVHGWNTKTEYRDNYVEV